MMGLLLGMIGYWIVTFMPYGRVRRMCLKVVSYSSSRLLFHSQGYHWVTEYQKHPSQYLSDYPPDLNIPQEQVPIIIGNHVTYTDVFYINWKSHSGFVAKKEEQSVWAFRTAGNALGGIWVERGNNA